MILTDYFEVRWHGRGGQGTVTGAKSLAEAVQGTGKCVSAFPDYGPERRGAPVRAYNRFARTRIRTHLPVRHPDVVMVVDATLIGSPDVLVGVTDDTVFIVNTEKEGTEIRAKLGLEGHVLYTIPANVISVELFGREIPNSAMMGTFSRACPEIISRELLLREARHVFAHLLAADVVDRNLAAIERGHDEAITA